MEVFTTGRMQEDYTPIVMHFDSIVIGISEDSPYRYSPTIGLSR